MKRTFLIAIFVSTATAAETPKAHRLEHTDVLHGTTIADPYRWLEDLDSDKTRAWVKAQQAYTEAWFAKAGGREQALARMNRLWNFERMPPRLEGYAGITERGGRIFFTRQTGQQNQPVLYVRESGSVRDRVLLDVNSFSADGTAAISVWQPSPDGKWLAYGIARAGSDWQKWYVREVATGRDLPDELDWIKFSSPDWAADSSGLYYGRYPKPAGAALTGLNEGQQLWFHRLRSAQAADRLVYDRPDHRNWLFRADVTDDGAHLVITVFEGTRPETLLFYQDLKANDGKTHELISEFYAVQEFLGSREGRFIVRTTYNAPRGRIVSIDPTSPDRQTWREIVPESEHALEGAVLGGDSLVLSYLRPATGLARVVSIDGRNSQDVRLPANAAIKLAEDSRRYFSVTSFTTPEVVYDCRDPRQTCKPLVRPVVSFDKSAFEARQVFYPGKDGTRVPMFIVHRRGINLDGRNPTLLYGYGGFNVAVTPSFQPLFLGFLEMGGVVAVANLRGGSEYGEAWHKAGMKQFKQNVFDDFIAAAEYLIAEKYTSKERLAIHGRSNGGLLVGAVLNQRPDLFAAAVPAVGVMDMLRFHRFTIGHAWVSDYGSPDNPEEFRILRRYSPLHNIRESGSYPATLITTADHDDRVVPGHSFKYAAALQRAQVGPAPILIRIETSAGHGAGKPTSKRIEEDADILTFLANVLGMNEGPRSPRPD
ncbi:MAG TPA: prolyl oligopeptidase family serine peptidase [Bryobacteraceae bacterium]|nr:prolyl oligopeptidase family serine peptidase [Bryobacteraceae bacterium]